MPPKTRGRTSDLPWTLDPEQKQALKDVIEDVDPSYVDLIAGKIASRISGGAPATRRGSPVSMHEVRPSIGSEMGGMGFDFVSWVRQHPYKLIALSLGLVGGSFVFMRGVDYYFGKK